MTVTNQEQSGHRYRFAGRPRGRRHIGFHPRVRFFKPQGVPLRGLEIIELAAEEMEALRLKHIEELDQGECARRMKTSQSTFQRILAAANRKIALALVKGKAIRVGE